MKKRSFDEKVELVQNTCLVVCLGVILGYILLRLLGIS